MQTGLIHLSVGTIVSCVVGVLNNVGLHALPFLQHIDDEFDDPNLVGGVGGGVAPSGVGDRLLVSAILVKSRDCGIFF